MDSQTVEKIASSSVLLIAARIALVLLLPTLVWMNAQIGDIKIAQAETRKDIGAMEWKIDVLWKAYDREDHE